MSLINDYKKKKMCGSFIRVNNLPVGVTDSKADIILEKGKLYTEMYINISPDKLSYSTQQYLKNKLNNLQESNIALVDMNKSVPDDTVAIIIEFPKDRTVKSDSFTIRNHRFTVWTIKYYVGVTHIPIEIKYLFGSNLSDSASLYEVLVNNSLTVKQLENIIPILSDLGLSGRCLEEIICFTPRGSYDVSLSFNGDSYSTITLINDNKVVSVVNQNGVYLVPLNQYPHREFVKNTDDEMYLIFSNKNNDRRVLIYFERV